MFTYIQDSCELTSFLSFFLPQTRKISFKIINSPTKLLPRWCEVVTGSPFEKRVLPRDVSTRWNSTYDMLKAFLEMKDFVVKFTDRSSNELADFILDDDEWEAVEGLVHVLKVCFDFRLFFLSLFC